MNVIYYDGLDIKKRRKVEAILQQFPLSYRMVESEWGEATIATLVNEEKIKETLCSLPKLDLMIFHDVDDEQIQAISQALKEQDAHVERKCVVTKHNQAWRLVDLLQEIMEEHAYFQWYDTCKKLLMEVQQHQESAYTSASWATYQNAFMHALLLLQEGQPPKDQLETAVHQLQEAQANLQPKE